MKIFVTTRFAGDTNREGIEALCAAVRAAGLEDFSLIRDVENYQRMFPDPKELWQRAKTELELCDALLIDATDNPGGGRVVETGMAFALGKPVFVIVKKGLDYKDVYDGVATKIIHYENYRDITEALRPYAERPTPI